MSDQQDDRPFAQRHSRHPQALARESATSLEPAERERLKRLFLLYESSLSGDACTSMHVEGFKQLLRDVGAFNSRFQGLCVQGQVFLEFIKPCHSYRFELSQNLPGKQAVLVYKTTISSQMRAYLDADGAPKLTFRLFCQALARVAFISFPTMSPTSAFQHLVRVSIFNYSQGQGERQSSSHSSPAGALKSSMDTKEFKEEIVSDGCETKLLLLSTMGCLDRRPIDNTFVHHSEQEHISNRVKGMKNIYMWNHLDSLSDIYHKEACISFILLSPESFLRLLNLLFPSLAPGHQ
jgi:hypothetical protein